MSSARNKLVAKLDHIRTLKWGVIALLIVVAAQWMRNGKLQETRRVYVPPSMTQGVVTTFNEVPAPVIYTFGLYIFQQLNRWERDGEKDYPQEIYRLQGYMTPSCISAFRRDMNEKRKKGEIRRRSRMLQEISGRGYHPRRVSVEADDRWRVTYDFNVKETITDHEVKNVNLRYTLNIVRFDVDREVNPWGLAIECIGDVRPTLLTDDDLKRAF